LDVKTKPAEEFTETVEITEDVDEDMQIQEELERLNNEASARAKRDRRRANEKKTKTIQRMQLQMTAPMDIGQEFEDASLRSGQADIFDLSTADRNRKKLLATQDVSDSDLEEDRVAINGGEKDDEDGSGSEEERGIRVDALEDDLDAMYELYKANRSERDAKFKAKEARKLNKDREETWKGIREDKNSDDADSDSEEKSEVGGWEEMQGIKGDSDDSSSSESDSETSNPRKRRRSEALNGVDNVDRKRQKGNHGLVVKLKDSDAATSGGPSKTSQLWFSQDIFADLGDHVAQDSDRKSSESDGSEVGLHLTSGGDLLIRGLQGRIR
jgi:AdoMet-dependent rRNA methyltransferase SPB1